MGTAYRSKLITLKQKGLVKISERNMQFSLCKWDNCINSINILLLQSHLVL